MEKIIIISASELLREFFCLEAQNLGFFVDCFEKGGFYHTFLFYFIFLMFCGIDNSINGENEIFMKRKDT